MSASSVAEREPALALRSCSVSYGAVHALTGIDLTIDPGERVALIGPSGAGKSTLLRELYRRAPERCALVPQSYDLVPPLSVFHNVDAGRLDQRSLGRNLRNLLWPSAGDRAEVEVLLREVGLDGLARRRAGELSGGQQQRVAIARALRAGRPILLADEPVSAIDPTRAAEVLGKLMDHAATCVIAMHAIGPALEACTRVIALRDGRIALDRPSREVDTAMIDAVFAAA